MLSDKKNSKFRLDIGEKYFGVRAKERSWSEHHASFRSYGNSGKRLKTSKSTSDLENNSGLNVETYGTRNYQEISICKSWNSSTLDSSAT